MQNHRRLTVYQAAERLAVQVEDIAAQLGVRGQAALADQLRRASVSIISNIAEGCGRNTGKDFRRALHMALGSAREVHAQLRHATQGLLPPVRPVRDAIPLAITVGRMLTALIDASRNRDRPLQ